MTGDGSPNAGWWRSGNGEWYPPELLPHGWSVGPDGVPRSFELPALMPVMRSPSPWERLGDAYRSWPVWAKVGPPLAALVLAGSAAAVFVLGDGDNDLDAVATTRTTAGTTPTRNSTTRPVPPAPVTVDGIVIVAPPTDATTTLPTTTNATVVSATTTTTRVNTVAAPTSTVPPPTTVPPTVGATTTASTTTAPTTTLPTISSTTTVPTTTLPTTTAPTTTTTLPTTTAPTTTGVTTTASTTTRATTTTRPPTTTRVTTTASTTTRAAVTHTVTGTVLVDSRMNVSGACGGSGRFSSFQNGQSIVLTGPSGQVVGQGVLTGCRWTDFRFTSGSLTAKPEFSFTMSGVVEVNSYTPRVASTTWPAVALSTIRSAGWTLDLEVN